MVSDKIVLSGTKSMVCISSLPIMLIILLIDYTMLHASRRAPGRAFYDTIQKDFVNFAAEVQKETMSSVPKLMTSVLNGTRDNNIAFSDLQRVLVSLGFQCRVKGDHFIYWQNGVEEIINIQPDGNKAKAYQVKQVRNIILKYRLGI